MRPVGTLFMQSEGNESEDETSDEYAESEDSDAREKPRRKKFPSSKQKRTGQAAPTPPSAGSGAKRLKRASDEASYAITEMKLPESSVCAAKARPAGPRLGSPVGTPTARPSPKTKLSVLRLSSHVSSAAPAPRTGIPLPEGVLETGRHTHHGLRWLYKDRTDKDRRRPDDSQYNPRTLYVPPSFLKSETPAMQQWWLFKSENMDTVLFFKVLFFKVRYMCVSVLCAASLNPLSL